MILNDTLSTWTLLLLTRVNYFSYTNIRKIPPAILTVYLDVNVRG